MIAVGDPGQLASVQAGGWLAALADRHPGPQLREVVRQRDPAERDALEALHDGHPDAYLENAHDAITVHDDHDQAVEALVEQWATARRQHGEDSTVMLVRDNQTLNHAAREQLKRDGSLASRGVFVARREYTAGDRVIARRNDRGTDVDNGTLGTVISIDDRAHRMIIQTAGGDRRELDLAYVARHVEHAYALTAHGAQGSTLNWAGVIGRPAEFSREWAYTALSRAREKTTLHVIAEPAGEARERASFAPAPARTTTTTKAFATLARAMRRSETELLALDQHALRVALSQGTGERRPAVRPSTRAPAFSSARAPTVQR